MSSTVTTADTVRLAAELPIVPIRLSLHETGLLLSILGERATAALDAGDASLHRRLRDRAADLRETAAANAKRVFRDLRAKRSSRSNLVAAQ